MKFRPSVLGASVPGYAFNKIELLQCRGTRVVPSSGAPLVFSFPGKLTVINDPYPRTWEAAQRIPET